MRMSEDCGLKTVPKSKPSALVIRRGEDFLYGEWMGAAGKQMN